MSKFDRSLVGKFATTVVCAIASTSMPLLAGAAATPSATNMPTGVVATVNGVNITEVQVDDQLRVAVSLEHRPDSSQLREAVRQQLIARELLRQDAEKAGYGTRPEVQQAMDVARVNAETQLLLKDKVHPDPVSDAQVRARYEEAVAALGEDEYKSRIILVPDAAMANTVLAGIKAGHPFDALARQYSEARDAQAGGELPWVSFKTPPVEGKTQGLPLPVAQAIARLPVGGVTPQPVAIGLDGTGPYVVVKVESKRPTQVPRFDDVKEMIHQELQALALDKALSLFMAELSKSATIGQ